MGKLIVPKDNYDCEITDVVPKDGGQEFQLEQLQELVGGNIEVLTMKGGSMLVFNEEGKYVDHFRNLIATNIARGYISGDDYIAGPCLHLLKGEMS